jgi:serine protease Do
MMSSLTPQSARALGLRDTSGVLITEIGAGSPAEAAGLRPGDVVRTFNGRAVADPVALLARLAETDIGAEVQLGIVRGGQPMTLPAKIGEAPAGPVIQRAPQRQRVP